MSKFSFLSSIFGGERSLSSEEQKKLFEELLLLTLSRASRSDLDISAVEVEKIQQILKSAADLEVSGQEVRTAGMSELYEVAPLEKYVAKTSKGLTDDQRRTIISSLFDVISVDEKVSRTEADFYNGIAKAMGLKPIDMSGTKIDGE